MEEKNIFKFLREGNLENVKYLIGIENIDINNSDFVIKIK